MPDAIQQFKDNQRASWATFAPLEMVTIPSAGRLVRFAGVKTGQKVLDVACGTGVVALTSRRVGARVTGLDLTPELLARAKEHSAVQGYEDIVWKEGDAEILPFDDGAFDVVLSQFGHMFAPRPEVVIKEMLRVLKPGGVIAFNTWPPELCIGRIFSLVGSYSPPLAPGISPSPQWGDVGIVKQRLGAAVKDVRCDRDCMLFPAVSVAHYRESLEHQSGPVIKIVERLRSEPQTLAKFRAELEGIANEYFEPTRNEIRMDYLMTRAVKV